MRIHATHYLATVLCSLLLSSPAFAQLAVPSNLHVPPVYRELVESIAMRSATFRRQLSRVAEQPGLTIDLEVVPRIIGARAMTRIVRQMNGLTAHIEVARFDDLVELIAHEIEHVIEQIDAVDLAASAGLPGTGIYSVATRGIVFETERAKRVGLVVAQEVRAFST